MTNVVDSSGWIEYFENGGNAAFFAPIIEAADALIVPTICIYEVFRRINLVQGEDVAVRAIGFMVTGVVVELSQPIAISAAKISPQYKLAMADSLILATAREQGATLWTQDKHFRNLKRVKYFEKQ